MTARKLLKSGFSLASSQGIVQACSFFRNVVIARIITPADYGIGAIFAMTWTLLEMVSNMAAEKLLIQAEDGNQPRFQGTIQLVQACRGLMIGMCIFLVAEPISNLFSVPHAKWAFRCLALAPILRGLTHEDPTRMQRELKFRPTIMVEVTTSLLATLFAVVLVFWLRDYSVMLWVSIIQVFLTLLISHLVAERPYRWAVERQFARRILSFGWPLLVNGVLLFVIFQGDQFVIGSAPKLFSESTYKLADLGIYSVAFALTMAPTLLVANVATSLFLPLLARVQHSHEDFERRYVACARAVCLLAALLSIPVIVVGHWLVLLVYGSKYAAAGTFIGLLAAMWALRIIRVAPTLAAMAKSDTRNGMISNVVRSLALVGVLFAVALGGPLTWVALCGFFAEIVALTVNVGRLALRHGVPVGLCLKPALVTTVGMGIAALTVLSGISQVGWFVALIISAVLMGGVLVSMLRLFPEFRRDVWALVFRSEYPLVA